MSEDDQSKKLGEWLQSLGCPIALSPADLQTLNSPDMRSVWRHLQAHVMPVCAAEHIRKNVLLAKLRKENAVPGQLGNVKVDSIRQLSKAKEMLKKEDEISKIKEEIRVVDEKLKSERVTLLKRTVEKESKRRKLKEVEDKVIILEMKKCQILKECEEFGDQKERVECLKVTKGSMPLSQLNQQKSSICKYVKNYKCSLTETDDEAQAEYLSEMMCSVLEFKPDAILDGILQISNQALRGLVALNPRNSINTNLKQRMVSNNILIFKEHLRDLNILIIKNAHKIRECLDKISVEKIELEKEKTTLINAIRETETTDCESNSEDGFSMEELVEDLLNKTRISKERETLSKLKTRLECECTESEGVSWSISNLAEKDNELWKEVEKKASEVKTVSSLVFNSSFNSEKLNEIRSKIAELVSEFSTTVRQKYQKNVSIDEFTDTMLKEIEIFRKTPMVALKREWDKGGELLPVDFGKTGSDDGSLLWILLQSEHKNSLTSVLEKFCWSLSVNSQFH